MQRKLQWYGDDCIYQSRETQISQFVEEPLTLFTSNVAALEREIELATEFFWVGICNSKSLQRPIFNPPTSPFPTLYPLNILYYGCHLKRMRKKLAYDVEEAHTRIPTAFHMLSRMENKLFSL